MGLRNSFNVHMGWNILGQKDMLMFALKQNNMKLFLLLQLSERVKIFMLYDKLKQNLEKNQLDWHTTSTSQPKELEPTHSKNIFRNINDFDSPHLDHFP